MNSHEFYENLDIDREKAQRENFEASQGEVNSFHNYVMKQSTISTIKDQLDFVVEGVLSGAYDPLDAFALIKRLEKMFYNAKENISDLALKEAEEYPQNSFVKNGFTFTKKKGARTFKFDEIEEWVKAKENLKNIEEKYKQAYFSHQRGLLNVTQDGEELTLPKVETGTDSLSVKIKY